MTDSTLPPEVNAPDVEPMTEEQWQRTLVHPETGEWDLERLLGFYAWHGRHHVAHLGLIR